ncbi:MAG: FHA domain-containing protein [Lentisphaeria bacterium]|nr:FHA domain-containing protein [Lentisphaeria bacterium]
MPVCRVYDSTGKELTQCTTDIYLPHSKIFFGRSSKCEICLKAFAESSISRQHFYLQESLTGQWEIYDNKSRAGVIQDAKKVPSAPLYDGTVVRFGNLFMAFGEKGVPSHYRLKWTDSTGQPKFGVLWEGYNSIGASRDNYVTVREGSVSRFHAMIRVNKNQVTIEPLNSLLEIEVNGEQIEGVSKLEGGDTFTMGGFPVELEYVTTVTKR